jgi:hypothetical protein
MKRGTEDLDFFIGDEALAAANGPGRQIFERWLDFLTSQVMAYTIQFDMDRSRTG